MFSDTRLRAVNAFRDLPLRYKGLAVIAIPLVGLLGVIVAFYLVQRANHEAEDSVRHTLEVRSQIQTVHSGLEEAESGVQGFLLTGDERWLDAYQKAERRLPGALSDLERLAADNADQLARVRRIRQLTASRLQELRALPARVGSRNGRSGPHPALSAGREQLQRIRGEIDALLREENRLLDIRTRHARSVGDRAYAVIAGGMLLAPMAAVLAMILFTAAIARRVHALEENANRLARGKAISPMHSGRDEIGSLELSLGAAAGLLTEREAELRRAKDDLERRVEDRTVELAAEIGERKRAEEELAELNQRLSVIIDASPAAIVGLDRDGIVRSWNPAAERTFGWAVGEVLNRPLPGLADEEGVELTSLLDGESLAGVETRRRRKDGALIDIRLWTAPVRAKSGRSGARSSSWAISPTSAGSNSSSTRPRKWRPSAAWRGASRTISTTSSR